MPVGEFLHFNHSLVSAAWVRFFILKGGSVQGANLKSESRSAPSNLLTGSRLRQTDKRSWRFGPTKRKVNNIVFVSKASDVIVLFMAGMLAPQEHHRD